MVEGKYILSALLSAALYPAVDACTSWVIHPSATQSGMMIVQKCRDSYRSGLDADIKISPRGIKYMRIGGNRHYPLFGMNDRGVAVTMNDGDRTDNLKHPEGERAGIYATTTIKLLIGSCESARQAVDMLLHIGRDKLKKGGNATYFVADAERAFMIEVAHGYAEAQEIAGGLTVISNTWHLPGGEEIATKTYSSMRGDRAREANTRASLKNARVDGKYTVRGCFDTSRRKSKKELNEYFPFRHGDGKRPWMSLGCVCFEIDREFPAFLSYGYMALGPQQQTVYLPIPMAIGQLPEKIRDGRWAQLAYELKDAGGDDQPSIADFARLEDKFLAEVNMVRDRARRLLKAGQKDEAVKLLDDCFARQFAEADLLLTRVHDEVVARAEKKKAEVAAQQPPPERK